MNKKKITTIILVISLLAQILFFNIIVFAQPQTKISTVLTGDVITDPSLNEEIRIKKGVNNGTTVLDGAWVTANITGPLDLRNTFGTGTIESIVGLEYATGLIALNLFGHPNLVRLDPIKDLSNLTELYASGCGLTSLPTSNTWSSLKKLDVGGNPGPISLEPIVSLSNLTVIVADLCGVPALPTNNWSSLMYLNVAGNSGISTLSTIAGITTLTDLFAYGCSLTSIPANSWNDLYTLNITDNIGPISLEPVENVSNLEVLSAGRCGLKSLPTDNTWNNLRQLYLNGNPGPISLDAISTKSELDLLSANNCGITSLPSTNSWNKLTDIDLANNHITDLSPISNVIARLSNPVSDRFSALNQTIIKPTVQAAYVGTLSIPNPFINYDSSVVAPTSFTTVGASYDSATNTINVPIDATHTTSFSIPPTDVGIFSAKFSGTVTQPYNPTKATPEIALSADPASKANHGASVTFTATVSGILGAISANDTVTFIIDGVSMQTVTLDANGEATYTTSNLSIGLHTIVATYNSNPNNNTATTNIKYTIIAAPTLNNPDTGANNPAVYVLFGAIILAASVKMVKTKKY